MKHHLFNRLRQGLALLLSLALVWTSGNLAQAAGLTADVFTAPSDLPQFQLQPPARLGRLVDYFNAQTEGQEVSRLGGKKAPLVVLIQDLHAHYGVQKNIAGLLEFLTQKLSDEPSSPSHPLTSSLPFALAVEGATGVVDNSVLASYPDKKVRDAATDYLLREAEITGADAFAIGHELPQAVNGVENLNFYQVNRDLFRQSLDGRTQLVQALQGIAADLETLQRSFFSREVKAFELKQRAYRDGQETPEAWISYLFSYPQARTLDLKKNFPSLSRFMAGSQALSADALRAKTSQFLTQIETQLSAQEKMNLRVLAKGESTAPYYRYLRELIYQKQLFMSVPLDLAQYLEYLHTAQTSEMDNVLFEAQALAYQVELLIAQGSRLKAPGNAASNLEPGASSAVTLLRVRHDVDLLKRIADLQATELEVRAFAPHLPEFIALTRTLLTSVKSEESSVEGNNALPFTLHSSQSIRRLISAAIDYYVMAMTRNQPMVDNSLALLGIRNQASGVSTKSLTPNSLPLTPNTLVLIAGGFHTASLTQILRDKNISYVVLTPTVDRLSPVDHELYLKRLRGDYLTEEDILSAATQRSGNFALALHIDENPLSRLVSSWRNLQTADSLAVARDQLFDSVARLTLQVVSHVLRRTAMPALKRSSVKTPTVGGGAMTLRVWVGQIWTGITTYLFDVQLAISGIHVPQWPGESRRAAQSTFPFAVFSTTWLLPSLMQLGVPITALFDSWPSTIVTLLGAAYEVYALTAVHLFSWVHEVDSGSAPKTDHDVIDVSGVQAPTVDASLPSLPSLADLNAPASFRFWWALYRGENMAVAIQKGRAGLTAERTALALISVAAAAVPHLFWLPLGFAFLHVILAVIVYVRSPHPLSWRSMAAPLGVLSLYAATGFLTMAPLAHWAQLIFGGISAAAAQVVHGRVDRAAFRQLSAQPTVLVLCEANVFRSRAVEELLNASEKIDSKFLIHSAAVGPVINDRGNAEGIATVELKDGLRKRLSRLGSRKLGHLALILASFQGHYSALPRRWEHDATLSIDKESLDRELENDWWKIYTTIDYKRARAELPPDAKDIRKALDDLEDLIDGIDRAVQRALVPSYKKDIAPEDQEEADLRATINAAPIQPITARMVRDATLVYVQDQAMADRVLLNFPLAAGKICVLATRLVDPMHVEKKERPEAIKKMRQTISDVIVPQIQRDLAAEALVPRALYGAARERARRILAQATPSPEGLYGLTDAYALPTKELTNDLLGYGSDSTPDTKSLPFVHPYFPEKPVILVSRRYGSNAYMRLGFLEDGTPVAVRTYIRPEDADKQLPDDEKGARVAHQIGYGGRVHGFYREGRYLLLVTDIMPGDFADEMRDYITVATILELPAVYAAAESAKHPVSKDLQYFVKPDHHIGLIDGTILVTPRDLKFDESLDMVDKVARLLSFANEDVRQEAKKALAAAAPKFAIAVANFVPSIQDDSHLPPLKFPRLNPASDDSSPNLAAGYSGQTVSHGWANGAVRPGIPEALQADTLAARQRALEQSDVQSVASYLNVDPKDGVNPVVIPVADLLKKTGQLAHIGLGRAYGRPVIYIDADYLKYSTLEGARNNVLRHEWSEIRFWEWIRTRLRLNPEQMRGWMQRYPRTARFLAWLGHWLAPSVTRELDDAHLNMRDHIIRIPAEAYVPDNQGPNLAAGGNPESESAGEVILPTEILSALEKLEPEAAKREVLIQSVKTLAATFKTSRYDTRDFLKTFLEQTIPGIAALSPDVATFQRNLASLQSLATRYAPLGRMGHDIFTDGLTNFIRASRQYPQFFSRVLAEADFMASQGVNPDSFLAYTLPAIYKAASYEWVIRHTLDTAHALAEKKIYPSKNLEDGVPSLASIAGAREDIFVQLLSATAGVLEAWDAKKPEDGPVLHLGAELEIFALYARREWAVLKALEEAKKMAETGQDPTHFLRGVISVAGGVMDDKALFMSALPSIKALAQTLQKTKFNPDDTLSKSLDTFFEKAGRNSWAILDVLNTANSLAKKSIDPKEFVVYAAPAIVVGMTSHQPPYAPALAALIDSEALQDEAQVKAVRALEQKDIVFSFAKVEHFLDSLAQKGIKEDDILKRVVPSAIEASRDRTDVFLDLLNAFESVIDATYVHHKYAGGVLEMLQREIPYELIREEVLYKKVLTLATAMAAQDMNFSHQMANAFYSVAWQNNFPAAYINTMLDFAIELVAKGVNPAASLGNLSSLGYAANYHQSYGVRKWVVPTILDAARRLADQKKDPGPFLTLTSALLEAAAYKEEKFKDILKDVESILNAGDVEGTESEFFESIHRLEPFLKKFPSAWSDLVVPTVKSQKVGSFFLLGTYSDLTEYVKSAQDIAFLRWLATNNGVRAWDYLENLVYTGLEAGAIGSLSEERELLTEFIENFPYPVVEFYAAYKQIRKSGAARAEQDRQIAELKKNLDVLKQAIVDGNVSPEQEKNPNFSAMLYYVFPPATTTERTQYLHLYERLADHPEHVAAHDPGDLQDKPYAFARGSYQLKDGAEIDLEAWRGLLSAVATVNKEEKPATEDLAALGKDLATLWSSSSLNKENVKAKLLVRLYRVHRNQGNSLPEELNKVPSLLAYKEFIGDRLRDLMQDALDAYRQQDEAAYNALIEKKFSTKGKAEDGLIKGVWQIVQKARLPPSDEHHISRDTAVRALEGRLKMFELPGEEAYKLVIGADSKEKVAAILQSLEAGEVQVQHGKESSRILQELTGNDQAAMRTQLFGGETAKPDADGNRAVAPKLEYKISEDSPKINVRFHVTKRKAHSPVALCEGVCTAPDEKLWDNPDFLQVAFFGDDGVSYGGMHLLIVEHEGKKYLTLPGINPSMAFLSHVNADDFLNAALGYARDLADHWNLEGVWIPTNSAIHSNRSPIQEAIKKKFASATPLNIPETRFSFAPKYMIDQVYIVEKDMDLSTQLNTSLAPVTQGGAVVRAWWYALPLAGLETARLFLLLHQNAADWHFNPVVLAALTLLTLIAIHLPQYLTKMNGRRTSVMETKPFWIVAGAEIAAVLIASMAGPVAAVLVISGAIIFHYAVNIQVFRWANPWVDRHYLARKRGLGFLAKLPGGKPVVSAEDVVDGVPMQQASTTLGQRELVDVQTAFQRASQDAFHGAA